MTKQVKLSPLGIIGGAFEVIANLMVIVDFFTSTMEPEVHEIYGFTYDTRENLKKVMEKMGVVYHHEKPDEIQNNWEKTTGAIKRTNDSLNEARMLNSEMAITVSEETNEMIGKSWEEYKSSRDLVREANTFNIEAIAAMNESLNAQAKELYDKTIEIHKKYPTTFTIPMVEEDTTPEDDGLAKADMEKVSGEVKVVGENVKELMATGSGGGMAPGMVGALIGPAIFASLERIESQLKATQAGGGELISEKVGDKKSEGDMLAESITGSVKQLERTYVKRIDRFEENFFNQFLDLINLIKRSSLTFKDIYEMLCKRMEHDLKYGRRRR